MPNHIFMIRGATEFYDYEITKRFPKRLCILLSVFLRRICSEMPLAARIAHKIFAVHSGISPHVSEF